MALPPQLKTKYIDHLKMLAEKGADIAHRLQNVYADNPAAEEYVEWGSRCASVLIQILPKNHPRFHEIQHFGSRTGCIPNSKGDVALVRAAYRDLEHGFFDNLADKIEAEFAADYMGQAVELLNEGQTGKHDHVPAAVLAGAILEKTLRSLCDRQTPPIPTVNPKGKTLDVGPVNNGTEKGECFQTDNGRTTSSMGAHPKQSRTWRV